MSLSYTPLVRYCAVQCGGHVIVWKTFPNVTFECGRSWSYKNTCIFVQCVNEYKSILQMYQKKLCLNTVCIIFNLEGKTYEP